MIVTPTPITVATTATVLCPAGSALDPVTVVVSSATEQVALGGADVTVATGFLLSPGDVFSLDLNRPTDVLYAISATGTATVRVLRTAS